MNLKKLYKEFENVGDRPGLGGKQFKYIKGAEVIHRLNEVFNGEWSLEIKDVITEGDDILVPVRLTVWSPSEGQPNKVIVKEQFGSATLKRYDSGPRKGQVVDYGNAFKSATTDGIKKAASLLGVGLYLYDLDNPIGLENGLDDEPAVIEPDLPRAEETVVSEPKPTIPPFEESTPLTEEPVVPNLDLPTEPVVSEENPDSSNITDIQKCAIENMSKMKDTTIEEVIKTVVGEDKPLDQLSYTEAAAAIKHVNTLKTPKKA
jgi:recombination DNA repair RAD52 pathway protein